MSLAAVLYRSTLRGIRGALYRASGRFHALEPLSAEAWGDGVLRTPELPVPTTAAVLFELLPESGSLADDVVEALARCTAESECEEDRQSLSPGNEHRGLSRELLYSVARKLYRREREDKGAVVHEGFAALRMLAVQKEMLASTSMALTEDGGSVVRTCVTSVYDAARSEQLARGGYADGGAAAFCYRVEVTNLGEGPVQLLGRHWVIDNDSDGTQSGVPRNSPGVVGEQPLLQPGTSFCYASGVVLPAGSMRGSFQMVALGSDGEPDHEFDAEVAPFALIPPPEEPDLDDDE